ncbi:glycine betaine/L-proline transporter ProP [Acinetobacter gerneri]|uniref:Glycine betaine/L-proline transporter ProP n=1 Tax=Acinetobacter gerneri TaxID=202952 RepID=A0AAW8JGB9_9GAMM|nr:glycine betaine/L-proline transporter ProP [Acinetobacter gerneri]MDQ9009765.1 glycine betaine/L-proline transporter ProP [Acinetobacter gerneri]MDQ9013737.1 glycine betaine/L-proline transporter ProP [Acinetobacter gerneri]MDQ9025151.1 glycine betaine/L-proline transporter ProP [Acinetobacter gerneri]MDQ9050914.1 glycine betaine/L-proline transporter ProP [Acinetobacter gerneri]MDQ9059734.1 glycine betaine/L-proline transporter ProP [Acinetobacter gerneri]
MRGFRRKTKPIELDDINIIDQEKTRKAITAAALGNAIEWFDFGVYGYVAYVLGKVFFPDASPSVQMIAALATFSVPFIFRPLGGLFFGRLGDKYGRQKVLAITIIIMSLSTFGIGLIPSFETIGIWAPILLLIVKVAQGFSIGGEYAGAAIFVAEYSPDRKRGFMGSWLDFGSIAGFVLGAGTVSLITFLVGESSFADWGWRIPFFLALPLGIIGLYLRNALDETPVYQQHSEAQSTQKPKKFSFKEILKNNKRALLVCIGLVICTNVTYYMLLTYLPSYFSHNLGYSESHGVLIIIAVMIGMLFVQPVIGWLSDKYGRRPFIFIGSIALVLFSYPAFILLDSRVTYQIFLGLLVLALSLNMLVGVMAATLPALFPTEIRYSALAIAFNFSVVIAGLTPTITAALVETTQNLMMPAYYLMVCGVFGVITAIFLKETANKPLVGGVPMATCEAEAVELLEEYHDKLEEKIENIDQKIEELQEKRQKLADQHPDIE